MRRAFEEPTTDNAAGLQQSGEVVMLGVFCRKNAQGEYRQHLLVLTTKFVLYYEDATKARLQRFLLIDFGCRFEMLKDPTGRAIGIRFERDNCQPEQLLSQDPLVLVGWERQLERCMNKRGFHEQFKPVKKIGKGNFAAVYLAARLRDGAKVAVKAFSKEHIYSQEKGRQSLINEIKLLRSFNHPNILRLMAVYESLNSVYLVMEHLEGSQLFNVIETHHFTLKEIQGLMRGLLSAAAEMARKNVVHRDLKPENIMFRTGQINSDIVVLDFGLSTFCDEKEYIYTRCGTPGFVAPEIVNIKDLTTKCRPISDVFSLGVILHILLLGKSPFKGKTFNEVLSENRQCNFTLTGTEYNALPAEAYDLLRRMLEKQPSLRISAEECLHQQFFVENMEIEDFQSSVKNPEELRVLGSSIPEDSYGKFVMKKPCNKVVGGHSVSDSIQIKPQSYGKSMLSPKVSKFMQSRSPARSPPLHYR